MPQHSRNLLTDKAIRARVREGTPGAVSDGAGLTLTISNTGYAAWILRYRFGGRRHEYTIGGLSDFSLADARREAEVLRQRVATGEDIRKVKRAQKARQIAGKEPETLRELGELWFNRTQEKRLKYPQKLSRTLEKWVYPKLGNLPLEDVTGARILNCLHAIEDQGAPTVMNDARRHIRKILDYAVVMGLLQTNVATGITQTEAGYKERPRDRHLALGEIETVLDAIKGARSWFGRENELAIRLLLLLGVRKQELVAASWPEFDLERGQWTIPKTRNKSGRDFVIPLPKKAVEYLRELEVRANNSEWVFPARRRGSRRLGHISPDTLNAILAQLDHGVDHFTVHDLRRTMRTHLSALGVRIEVAERCINHKLRGVIGIYDRFDFFDERTKALSRWSDVLEVLDKKGLDLARKLIDDSNIVQIRSDVA